MQLLRQGWRHYATSLILLLTIPIGELHNLWAGDPTVSNWICVKYRPMLTEWNVKLASQQLVIIMYFLAWFFHHKNPVNVATIKGFLLLSVMDTFAYFYNYKTVGYGSTYMWFIVFWVALVKKKELAKWLINRDPTPPPP